MATVSSATSVKARERLLAMLGARADGATICPSEVARAISPTDQTSDAWREWMPFVHAAVDLLVEEGAISLSWKGRRLVKRAGPYRISRNA